MGEEGAGQETEHDRHAADEEETLADGIQQASRLLVVRPICSSEPSGSSTLAEREIPFRVLGDADDNGTLSAALPQPGTSLNATQSSGTLMDRDAVVHGVDQADEHGVAALSAGWLAPNCAAR